MNVKLEFLKCVLHTMSTWLVMLVVVVSILINIKIDISVSPTTVYGTVEHLTSGWDFADRTVRPI